MSPAQQNAVQEASKLIQAHFPNHKNFAVVIGVIQDAGNGFDCHTHHHGKNSLKPMALCMLSETVMKGFRDADNSST